LVQPSSSENAQMDLWNSFFLFWTNLGYVTGKCCGRTAACWLFTLVRQEQPVLQSINPVVRLDCLLGADEKRSVRARALASYLLESILNLGPTFIKIGQLCSTRSDLFPAEVTIMQGMLLLQLLLLLFRPQELYAVVMQPQAAPQQQVTEPAGKETSKLTKYQSDPWSCMSMFAVVMPY
jgi:hypothetical protein